MRVTIIILAISAGLSLFKLIHFAFVVNEKREIKNSEYLPIIIWFVFSILGLMIGTW